MSAARLLGLALIAAVVSLPSLAREAPQLRGRLDADFSAEPARADEKLEILPKVVVTETARKTMLVSKPAILRYDVAPEVPARMVAETRGQDPDRIGDQAASASR